ncbi:MAG: hypothetical protein VW333_08320, partial [Pseudomonadales bacterium]
AWVTLADFTGIDQHNLGVRIERLPTIGARYPGESGANNDQVNIEILAQGRMGLSSGQALVPATR